MPDNSYGPIVLDLDGDGIELVAADQSTAAFDVDRNGSLNVTGWVSADDGLLVFDMNETGSADLHAFGMSTPRNIGDMTIESFADLARLRADGTPASDRRGRGMGRMVTSLHLQSLANLRAGYLSTAAADYSAALPWTSYGGNGVIRDIREIAFSDWTAADDTDYQAFARMFDNNGTAGEFTGCRLGELPCLARR